MKLSQIENLCDEILSLKVGDIEKLRSMNELLSNLMILRGRIDKTIKVMNWHLK